MRNGIFSMEEKELELVNVSICNSFEKIEKANIVIKNGLIKSISSKKSTTSNMVDLNGYFLYPALINGHDHLLGTYLPKVGNGPYLNWKPWDEDLKASAVYQERGKISNQSLYTLGNYRQILSGVTTVSDHIPHKINDEYAKQSFVRILKNYTLSHEFTSYDLNWGDPPEIEIKRSKEKDLVFLTHLGEGFDQEAVESIIRLEKSGGLYENTVLVHCVVCSHEDIKKIAKSKSSVVWCPSSNWFMFQKTMDVRRMLEEGVNVCLGTDSPMSGGVNLLEELRFAQSLYKRLYQESLSDRDLFQMVTYNPAKAFKIQDKLGSIEVGKEADFILLKQSDSKNFYQTLFSATTADIVWVVSRGKTLFVREKWADSFRINKSLYQLVGLDNSLVERYFLVGKPLDLGRSIKSSLGYDKRIEFFPIQWDKDVINS